MLQDVKLTNFDEKTQLGKDIRDWAKKYKREVRFPLGPELFVLPAVSLEDLLVVW